MALVTKPVPPVFVLSKLTISERLVVVEPQPKRLVATETVPEKPLPAVTTAVNWSYVRPKFAERPSPAGPRKVSNEVPVPAIEDAKANVIPVEEVEVIDDRAKDMPAAAATQLKPDLSSPVPPVTRKVRVDAVFETKPASNVLAEPVAAHTRVGVPVAVVV